MEYFKGLVRVAVPWRQAIGRGGRYLKCNVDCRQGSKSYRHQMNSSWVQVATAPRAKTRTNSK